MRRRLYRQRSRRRSWYILTKKFNQRYGILNIDEYFKKFISFKLKLDYGNIQKIFGISIVYILRCLMASQKLICVEKCDYSIMLLEIFIMIFAT